jgi:hypothetical protein
MAVALDVRRDVLATEQVRHALHDLGHESRVLAALAMRQDLLATMQERCVV